ncbi:MAG: TatD family hydrolase [Chloroflexota bacterium]|nr:TatD family hydrolase [Chloroflexota bacterium]|tara:strand:+ start:827 stop:1579 length:753 start_codon:yes stop_codon:yes gene_type:complete
MFIDIHTHLSQYKDGEIPSIVKRWREADVELVVSSGTTIKDSIKSIELAKKYPDIVAGIGLHPSDLTNHWKDDLLELKKILNKSISMVSEIGLDYQDSSPDKKIQIIAFEEQIQISIDNNLPIVFHTRFAMEDSYNVLASFKGNLNGGAVHYFDGNYKEAKKMIDLGFKISFAKTLIRNDYLKDVAKKVSIDDITIETDSYPQYFKKNRERWTEPKDVVLVAKELSVIKNLPIELIAEKTKNNFMSFIKN